MSLIVIKAINGSPVSVTGKFVGGSWDIYGPFGAASTDMRDAGGASLYQSLDLFENSWYHDMRPM